MLRDCNVTYFIFFFSSLVVVTKLCLPWGPEDYSYAPQYHLMRKVGPAGLGLTVLLFLLQKTNTALKECIHLLLISDSQ